MKTLNIYAALLFSIFAMNISFAQTSVKKETIKVSGNCGMCKNKIEKSAKSAGATYANWSEETKLLNVSYNPSRSSSEKIQKAIAASGYDTQNFKAADNAYNKLDKCCQYSRESTVMNCCKGKACSKNGKCDKDACKNIPECKTMTCCKS
jgi:hypothetical protein